MGPRACLDVGSKRITHTHFLESNLVRPARSLITITNVTAPKE